MAANGLKWLELLKVAGKLFSYRNMQEPERSDHSPES